MIKKYFLLKHAYFKNWLQDSRSLEQRAVTLSSSCQFFQHGSRILMHFLCKIVQFVEDLSAMCPGRRVSKNCWIPTVDNVRRRPQPWGGGFFPYSQVVVCLTRCHRKNCGVQVLMITVGGIF
jgi:hypothetical protein